MGSGHQDEMNRRAISAFSHILLCNTVEDRDNLIRLGEEEFRIFVVGSTAFDYIKINERLCPAEPYDLVLLHPEDTVEDIEQDLHELLAYLKSCERFVVWLPPNHDRHSDIILRRMANTGKSLTEYASLNRPCFLGLLKNCVNFVGNSSAMQYEAPFFKVKTVHIGRRNRDRPIITVQVGGSVRIANILRDIPLTDELRHKKLVLPQ
jgi:UDP-N-acetylglucosamine 2-epimerase